MGDEHVEEWDHAEKQDFDRLCEFMIKTADELNKCAGNNEPEDDQKRNKISSRILFRSVDT